MLCAEDEAEGDTKAEADAVEEDGANGEASFPVHWLLLDIPDLASNIVSCPNRCCR